MRSWIERYDAVFPRALHTRAQNIGLLCLRVSIGLMMLLSHGLPKLEKLLAGQTHFADPLGIGQWPSLVLASGAEFFASILLVLGLLTRASCLPLAFTMGVAAFIVHAGDPFAKQEFALLYLSAYLSILFTGPGGYSLDALLMNRLRESS